MTRLPDIETDFPAWYAEVVRGAELAEHSSVRGSMVIRPHGYAIWELLQRELNDRIKATGHENVYFPLLVPRSVMARETDLIEGFAPEVAVVTEAGGSGLGEPLGGGPACGAAAVRGVDRGHLRRGDPVLPRPAAAVQPVGQRRAVGAASAALPAHHRVPVAGGAHGPRDRGGGHRRDPHGPP